MTTGGRHRDDPPVDLPGSVQAAYARADRMGFDLSSEPEVGWLLASLSAAVPPEGRVLELGTGAGVGLTWIVHGLGDRSDVEVVTVESDPELATQLRSLPWPDWVRVEVGDGAELVGTLGQFDLIFPDAPGGKIFKLRKTIAALRPGGVLVVDDMDLSRDHSAHPDLPAALQTVRNRLVGDPTLVCAELSCGSGVIVATRRR
jgi:predicted O-methyltransferase YrrM